jgi:hypothetical protein
VSVTGEFFGRKRELKQLRAIWDKPAADLVFIRGRRRVGKSRLLRHLAADEHKPGGRAFFFTGRVDETDVACRERFARDFDAFTGKSSLTSLRRSALSWDRILTEVSRHAAELSAQAGPKLLLIIDEIQWLAKRHSGVLGALKEFWEKTHPVTPIKVLISGSSNRFFAASVDHSEGVLRGLRTKGDVVVSPFNLAEVAAYYFPTWTREQVALVYMLLGGVPYYLEQLSDTSNFLRSLNNALFSSQSIFLGEIDAVLKVETAGKGALENVKRVLAALGQDGSTEARIAETTGLGQTSIHDILGRIESYGIVRERLPFGAKRERKRDVRYYMDDFYLNTYFQILRPLMPRIQSNTSGGMLVKEVITSAEGYYIGDFSGKAFELLVMHVLNAGIADTAARDAPIFRILELGDATFEVATYWEHGQTQIDILVSCDDDRQVRVLEAKWKASTLTAAETGVFIKAVAEKTFPLPSKTWSRRNLLILSNGLSPNGMERAMEAHVGVLKLEHLFGEHARTDVPS